MPDYQDNEQDKTTFNPQLARMSTREIEIRTIIDGVYQIEREIGSGGAGSVYKVNHVELEKAFAIKVLHDTYSEIAMKRFHKEAQIAASLDHPNLVRAVHSGTLPDGKPFYVMDFVTGMTLAEHLQEGPLRPSKIIDIFIPLCVALDYAHARGLVHRDLKPGNTVLTVEHGEVVPKIIDFGIAHLALSETSKGVNLTRTGEIFGTPKYMSPEQSLSKKVDQRSDIYSLGCMMFECLTGKVPFTGENALATIMLHVSDKPPTLSEAAHGREFPKGWQQLIDKMLAKNPEDRFETCGQVAKALEAIRDNTVEISRPKKEVVVHHNPVWQSTPVIAGVCITAFAIAGGAAFYFLRVTPAPPPVAVKPTIPAVAAVAPEIGPVPKPSGNELLLAAQKFPQSEGLFQKSLQAAETGDWANAISFSNRSSENLQARIEKNMKPEYEYAISIRKAVTALAFSKIGVGISKQQQLQGALAYINQAIQHNPWASQYFTLRGNLNKAMEDSNAADADFAEAKKLADSGPPTECDKIMQRIIEGSSQVDITKSSADSSGDKYTAAKDLLADGKYRQAELAFYSMIGDLSKDAQKRGVSPDMSRCSLYYALIGYSLLHQTETSNDSTALLERALKSTETALNLDAHAIEIYRIKSMILRKQGSDDLARENDEIYEEKKADAVDDLVNNELQSVIK